jgi:hypothetical protein
MHHGPGIHYCEKYISPDSLRLQRHCLRGRGRVSNKRVVSRTVGHVAKKASRDLILLTIPLRAVGWRRLPSVSLLAESADNLGIRPPAFTAAMTNRQNENRCGAAPACVRGRDSRQRCPGRTETGATIVVEAAPIASQKSFCPSASFGEGSWLLSICR